MNWQGKRGGLLSFVIAMVGLALALFPAASAREIDTSINVALVRFYVDQAG